MYGLGRFAIAYLLTREGGKMKKYNSNIIIAIILILIIFILTSCNNQNVSLDYIAMGRYIEEEIPFKGVEQDGDYHYRFIQGYQNEKWLIAYKEVKFKMEQSIELYKWNEQDWLQAEFQWESILNQNQLELRDIFALSNGEIYAFCKQYNTNNYSVVLLNEKGQVDVYYDLPNYILEGKELIKCTLLNNGNLILASNSNNQYHIQIIDQDGEEVALLECDRSADFGVYRDYIYTLSIIDNVIRV